MDNRLFVQSQPFTLAGSGVAIGAGSVILSSFQTIDGVDLAMTDFGTKGYGTIDPGNGTKEEQISFTGVTPNANGTATLTGVSTVGFIAPYTEVANVAKSHAGGAFFVISNTSAFYNDFANKNDNETVNQIWTFATGATPVITDTPLNPTDAANKAYIDGIAIAGSPDSSTIVKGIGRVSVAPVDPVTPIFVGDNDGRVPTQAENNALVGNNTTIAVGAGNLYVTQTGLQTAAEVYAVDAQANDTYVVTLSPVPTAYVAGMTVRFKAATTNTGAATLNVNGLGAIAITKNGATVLEDNDIKAGQTVTVVYDSVGPKFQIQSLDKMSQANATTLTTGATTSADTLHTHSLNNVLLQTLGTGRQMINLLDLCDRTASSGFGESVFTACTIAEYAPTVYFETPATTGQGGNVATTTFASNSVATAWTKNHSMYFGMVLSQITAQDVFAGIGGAVTIAAANGTSTTKHIGIFIEDATIWASNADGVTQTRTDVSAGITLTAVNTFSWDFTSGTNIKFYINGTLVATHTTNLPGADGTNFEPIFGLATAANASKNGYFFRRVILLLKEV